MSEKELGEILGKNPSLRARELPFAAAPFKKKEKARPRKYRNIKVYEDETGKFGTDRSALRGKVEVFDSIKEHGRHRELLALEKAGIVTDLRRQEKLVIAEAFQKDGEKVREISCVADFAYTEDGRTVIEDVKPFDLKTGKHRLTKDFALKWKLLKHRYRDFDFRLY
jgi:hypothetical protein